MPHIGDIPTTHTPHCHCTLPHSHLLYTHTHTLPHLPLHTLYTHIHTPHTFTHTHLLPTTPFTDRLHHHTFAYRYPAILPLLPLTFRRHGYRPPLPLLRYLPAISFHWDGFCRFLSTAPPHLPTTPQRAGALFGSRFLATTLVRLRDGVAWLLHYLHYRCLLPDLFTCGLPRTTGTYALYLALHYSATLPVTNLLTLLSPFKQPYAALPYR